MAGYSYKTKIGGKDVTLNLSDLEVLRAMSIIDSKGIDSVCVMKKDKGQAQMFSNQRQAIACQERKKFEYMFTVKKDDLSSYAAKLDLNTVLGINKKKTTKKTSNSDE